jgi:hypothetical protein
MGDEIDLAYRILDLDLVDSEERRCGKVDDLEFDGEPGGPVYVAAIVSGGSALRERFPRRLRNAGGLLFRGEATRVGWSEVEDFDSRIELRSTAADLGLARGDRDRAPFGNLGEGS